MLRMRGAGYRYPSLEAPSAGPTDLAVEAGELVLLTGPTGCGKSTLLRLAAGLLQRHGRGQVLGTVTVDGDAPHELAPRDRVGRLGFVSQEPSDQIVAGTLGDEIGFGLESVGWPADRIAVRVDELLRQVGLPTDPERSALALSGGQRQKLVVAAALAAGARLLLLDEPISQMDPLSAQELLTLLRRLADGGIAVLLVEHRLEAVLPFADRLVVMDEGCVVGDSPADAPDLALLRDLGLSVPGMLDLVDRLGGRPVRTGAWSASRPVRPVARAQGSVVLEGSGLSHRFAGRGRQPSVVALDGVDVSFRAGERIALVGGNGAGKSTLLGLLAGHLSGPVRRVGRVVDVPQDPDLALFCSTVRDELGYGPVEARRDEVEVARRTGEAATALSLAELLDRPPQALSRGQRLRTAVAAALTCRPQALLLDEPTSGQDSDQVGRMMDGLQTALADGLLVFATHDLGLALRWATRAVLLHEGRILRDGPPAEVLAGLPQEVPLLLPPLARWCLERKLPCRPAVELVSLLEAE
jgi:energy-coupling factor transport system ATP-binding protein